MARKPADQSVNRIDILQAAARVFRRQGYHGAKMADIAAQVDLTAGSLYHHFPDGKQQLLIEVLTVGLEQITMKAQAVLYDDLLPEEKLYKLVKTHVINLTRNTAVAAALVFEMRTLLEDPVVRESYLVRRDAFEQIYRTVIRDGINSGVFRQVDIPVFVKTMLGAHNWVGVWYREDGRLTGEQVAEEIAETFLAALRPY